MNRTIAQEWQYARAYESEAERTSSLTAFIERYNRSQPYSASGVCSHAVHPGCKQPIGTQHLAVKTIEVCAEETEQFYYVS